MKRLIMAFAVLLALAGTSTWAQAPDPHHPAQNTTAAPQPASPAPAQSPSAQPPQGEGQHGGMMNCPMMQGQMAQGAGANCKQGQAQGSGPAMMHDMMHGSTQSGQTPTEPSSASVGSEQTKTTCCQAPTKSQ